MALAIKEVLSPAGTQFTANGTYTFPSNVTKVRAFLWGGGGGGTAGGAGAYLAVDIPKGARTTLTVVLNQGRGSQGPGGGGLGGGFSGISTVADSYIAIAGGGGGTGNGYFGGGGGFFNASQGGNATQTGIVSTASNFSHGGGGSQTVGGSGGVSPFNATFYNGGAGSSLQGGNAPGTGYGGGGGGGYYGGGAGGGDANQSPYTGMGAGGGGSSYVSSVGTLIEGQAGPNGTATGVNPGGRNSGYYTGTFGASNNAGLVVIVPFLPVQQIAPQMRLSNQTIISQTATFLGTGSVQTWTVPAGVYNFKFFLWGSGGTSFGGGEAGRAGQGGYVEGNLTTTPGTTYHIVVGRHGASGIGNGGGSTGATNGGGFSGIFSGSPAANNVIAIAGGGGGGGIVGAGYAGSGGYPAGSSATGSGGQGGGGTQTAGGAGAGGGSSGTQLQGGNSYGGDNGGGGGGGGWYGGGAGGAQGAGGGGSSTYISSVVNPYVINGTPGDNTNPTVAKPAPNESSPYWISPYGRAQQFGLVVIGYGVTAPVNPVIFSYTGSYQTYTVGSVSSVYVYMWGAGGSGNNQGVNGGAGAFLNGILSVTPGETLRLIVGKGGVPGGQNATDAQGYGGSSLGSANSAQGGGRSAIQRGSGASYTEIVTVGGGGGAGYYSTPGGAGSYTTQGHRASDQALTTTASRNASNGGMAGGGGPTSGGLPSYNTSSPPSSTVIANATGKQFQGGDAQQTAGNPVSGGGGAGYWGGGAGIGNTSGYEGGGGGGGSSYTANLTGVSGEDSAGQPAPGTSSSYYPSGSIIAAGGISNTQNGGDGRIVIIPLQLPNPLFIISPRVSETTLQAFTSTGAVQTYTVPSGTTFINIYAWGAGGNNVSGFGGGGGFVSGRLRVSPGQVLYIIVGTYSGGYPSVNLGGGGGQMNKYFYNGGGGFSGVFLRTPVARSSCVCVAGGGGAGNFSYVRALSGGPGGYPNGLPGNSFPSGSIFGGGGATQDRGGIGYGGGDGVEFIGGNGISTASDAGAVGGPGSGGGGWFGGGASIINTTNGGGGGGSSFIGGLLQPIQTANGQYAPGENTTASAGGESSPYWQSPYGRSGQNGYVVITRV